MVQHSVIFSLKSGLSTPEKLAFFEEAQKLAAVPGVQNFEILAQTSPKNNFDYGILMAFETVDQYDHYTHHPDHVHFVQNVWLKSVKDFLEIDYQPLD